MSCGVLDMCAWMELFNTSIPEKMALKCLFAQGSFNEVVFLQVEFIN